jgi:hypothetical protein
MSEDNLTYTDVGWPRPIIGGWPIPWVTPAENLKQTDPDRMSLVVEYALCQVCGLGHNPMGFVYFFVNLEVGPIPINLEDKIVQAMDNAVLHESCMKLAVGRCPALRDLLAREMLVMYRARWKCVKIHEIPDAADKDKRESFKLCVEGMEVERCPL